MILPRHNAAVPPPRESGLARAQNIGALTQTSDQALYSGLGAFGRGLNATSDYAFRQTQERHDIDTKLQFSRATTDYESYYLQLQKSLAESNVTTDGQRGVMHGKLMTEVDKYYQNKLKEIDNKDAIDLINESWQKDRIRYDSATWSILTSRLDSHQRAAGLEIGKSFILNGQPEQAEKHFNELVSRGLYTEKEVKDYQEMVRVDNDARGQLAQGKTFDEIRNSIMSENIDTAIKRKIVSDIQFEASELEILKQQQIERKDTEYYTMYRNGNLAELKDKITQDLSAGIIPAELAKEYDTRIERRNKEILEGKKIETNQFIKGDLETMAYGIHDGSVTMPNFMKRLKDAFDNGDIDDNAYDSLLTIAQGKYESYQAREMSARITHARGQLLTYGDELSFVEMLQKKTAAEADQLTSDRQLQLDNLDRYRMALNDWFQNQREQGKYPTASEIYTEGRKLLVHFRKTTAELREEQANRFSEEQAEGFRIKNISEKFNISEKKAKEILDKQAEYKKQQPQDKYAQQIDYLAIQFNLNDTEKQFVRDALNRGVSLDDLVKHLQGKDESRPK